MAIMNFGLVTTAPCVNTPQPPDPRCSDPAFALANPDICPITPQLVIKPALALTCPLGSVQFRAFVISNGKEQDVTSQTRFTSSDPDVALIGSASGSCTGVASGNSTISATYKDMQAFSTLTVIGNSATCCGDNTKVAMMALLDNSLSMSQAFSADYTTKLAFAKAALKAFVGTINTQKDVIGLISFNAVDDTLLEAPTNDISGISTLISAVPQSQQKTLFYDALSSAIDAVNATTSDVKVLILATDGEDTATTYTDKNPIQLLSDFKASGGIVICLGVRAHGAGYNLLQAICTGGFFINAFDTTAASAIDLFIGVKGYITGGNCAPQTDSLIGAGAINYGSFINWNVVGGTVDLQGNGFFDCLPGNGLYVDLAGTNPPQTGKLVLKTALSLTAGDNYRIAVDLAGNNRVNYSPQAVQIRVYYLSNNSGQTPIYLVDQTVVINDYTLPFQTYAFNFSAPSTVSAYISIQQIETPSGADAKIGVFLGRVQFQDTTNLIVFLDDDFDSENPTYVPPRCGTGTIYRPSEPGGYVMTHTCCYGDGCLDTPPGVQVEDPKPLPDIESGYTPPVQYTSTKQACASCGAGQINLSSLNLIPVMTSDSAPSGQAISNDEFNPAWNAFDNDASTFWRGTVDSGIYIGYKFAAATVVGAYALNSQRGSAPGSFTFQASNDGSTWTVLDTRTNLSWAFGGETKTFTTNNTTAYLYYRVNISANDLGVNGGNPAIWTFEMYTTAPGQVCKTATATSTVSQADADNQAYSAALTAAQALLNCVTQYSSTEQYTAQCPAGSLGQPVTKSATATSLVSQDEADQKALQEAKADAEAELTCTGSNNTQAITINDSGNGSLAPATPYPSVKYVSGLTGSTTKVTVTIKGLSHSYSDDIFIVLKAPTGETVLLMANAGGANAANNLTLTFDDAAGSMIPDGGPIVGGTFKPSAYNIGATLPQPGPAPAYGSTLAVLNGKNPNGSWSLWVCDDTPLNSGTIAQGWDMTITSA